MGERVKKFAGFGKVIKKGGARRGLNRGGGDR
jgi:hypothetical protein